MHVDKIAFLTDLSGRETHAYRTAAALAGKLGALLQLVHVTVQGGRCLRRAEEQLSEAVAEEPAFRGVLVQTVLLAGSDGYASVSDFTTRENTKLIVCAHSDLEPSGYGGERLLPERLVDVCPAPLLVLARDDQLASQRDDLGPRRVLIPYALYETSHESVNVRRFLARDDHPVSFYLYRRPEGASFEPYDEEQDLESVGGGETEAVHVLLGSGPAGEELVKSARALDVDLIVVSPGVDGQSGISTEDLSWIVRHAPSSVLAVKAAVGQTSTAPVGEGYEFYCG